MFKCVPGRPSPWHRRIGWPGFDLMFLGRRKVSWPRHQLVSNFSPKRTTSPHGGNAKHDRQGHSPYSTQRTQVAPRGCGTVTWQRASESTSISPKQSGLVVPASSLDMTGMGGCRYSECCCSRSVLSMVRTISRHPTLLVE